MAEEPDDREPLQSILTDKVNVTRLPEDVFNDTGETGVTCDNHVWVNRKCKRMEKSFKSAHNFATLVLAIFKTAQFKIYYKGS